MSHSYVHFGSTPGLGFSSPSSQLSMAITKWHRYHSTTLSPTSSNTPKLDSQSLVVSNLSPSASPAPGGSRQATSPLIILLRCSLAILRQQQYFYSVLCSGPFDAPLYWIFTVDRPFQPYSEPASAPPTSFLALSP